MWYDTDMGCPHRKNDGQKGDETMFYIENNKIEPGELLFADDFRSAPLCENWEITGGEWKTENGVCIGLYRENAGGLIYSKRQFPGDVMLDFYAEIVPPCTNDLNFSFRARGWDYEKGDADIGYIAGLNGWYINRTGIERYPELNITAMTEAFKAESGREYHIQTGIVGRVAFIAVDGVVVVSLMDPHPIDREDCCRVGLGTYCSHIRFRDFRLYRPTVTPVEMRYTPVF